MRSNAVTKKESSYVLQTKALYKVSVWRAVKFKIHDTYTQTHLKLYWVRFQPVKINWILLRFDWVWFFRFENRLYPILGCTIWKSIFNHFFLIPFWIHFFFSKKFVERISLNAKTVSAKNDRPEKQYAAILFTIEVHTHMHWLIHELTPLWVCACMCQNIKMYVRN